MKVHELAKELAIPSKTILDIINTGAEKPRTASSNLTEDEAEKIRQTAEMTSATIKSDTTPDDSTPAADIVTGNDAAGDFTATGLFTGDMVFPPRLYKYARARKIPLADAIAACDLLGIENPRDFMELDADRVRRLDAHFVSLPS